MPLPTPVQGESRSAFIKRCVPEAMKEAESNEQAVAICTTQFTDQRGDSVSDGKNQIRVDAGELSGRVERTEEGYLRGDAIVTRTGVFPYRNEDGTTRRELRHPDDVYEADSLATIKMIPVTDGHPGELVTAENANALAKGHTGENVRIDGRFVVAPLTVTHADMISSIEDGKSELSLGYMVDVVEEDGEYNGEPYTHRQRNIRYNHLAIVDRARAGAAARLNMDGAAVQESDSNPNREGETMTKKITLDGIEYEAAPEVINALQRAESRADELDGKLTDAQKRADEAEAKADAAVEERDKLKADASDEKVAERVQQRLDVERKAAKVLTLDEQAAKLSDRDLMLKAITAHNDSLDLSDRSDDYVRARFDSVIEAAEAEGIQRQRERVAGGRNDDAGGAPVDSEKARQDAATDITTAWKRKKPAVK